MKNQSMQFLQIGSSKYLTHVGFPITYSETYMYASRPRVENTKLYIGGTKICSFVWQNYFETMIEVYKSIGRTVTLHYCFSALFLCIGHKCGSKIFIRKSDRLLNLCILQECENNGSNWLNLYTKGYVKTFRFQIDLNNLCM